MKSSVVKRSIVIGGHPTSVSLEDAFWDDLKEIAHAQRATLSRLVAEIDGTRRQSNLSSAIRLFVLEHTQWVQANVSNEVLPALSLLRAAMGQRCMNVADGSRSPYWLWLDAYPTRIT